MLHGSRTFEHRSDDGVVIKGKADPSLDLATVAIWDLHPCTLRVRVKRWTRNGHEFRRRYALLGIEPPATTRIAVIPKYKNWPPSDAVQELAAVLASSFPGAAVVIRSPVEPLGHEATYWQVFQIVFSDLGTVVTLAQAVAAAKQFLKKRRESKDGKGPQSVHILGATNEELASVSMDEDDDEPREDHDDDDDSESSEET